MDVFDDLAISGMTLRPSLSLSLKVWMFDDLGLGNESRLLIVRVDESEGKAYLKWEYRLGALTQLFGDADPTIAGNVLGAFWIQEYGPATRWGDAQAGLVEVTRDTKEVAWQLLVEGDACDTDDGRCYHCTDDDGEGGDDHTDHDGAVQPHIGNWYLYSAERFYDAPVLPSPGSANEPTCHGGVLRFTVFNSFKQSTRFSGEFNVEVAPSGGSGIISSGGDDGDGDDGLMSQQSPVPTPAALPGRTQQSPVPTPAQTPPQTPPQSPRPTAGAGKRGGGDGGDDGNADDNDRSGRRGGGSEGGSDDDDDGRRGGDARNDDGDSGRRGGGGHGDDEGDDNRRSDSSGSSIGDDEETTRAHKVWCAAHPVKCSDADMLALDETRGKQNHNHDDDDDDDDSTGGQTIATGTFEFRAHWRPTEISVPIATEYCNHTSVKLTVTNERGKSAYATLECN